MPESASLGKDAKRASTRDLGISRNWRERTAFPPRVHIEAARTTLRSSQHFNFREKSREINHGEWDSCSNLEGGIDARMTSCQRASRVRFLPRSSLQSGKLWLASDWRSGNVFACRARWSVACPSECLGNFCDWTSAHVLELMRTTTSF